MSDLPIIIAPSILAADFAKLGEEVTAVDQAGADWIHIDVMDGHFVPNISFGAPVLSCIKPVTEKPMDTHLMIAPCDPFLSDFKSAGADLITVHAEAGPHLHRSLQAIKALGLKAGVSLNPATPINVIEHVLDDIDLVLIMSVNPGFGGQAFIPQTLTKVAQARAMIGTRTVHIEIDGGVDETNAADLTRAGANALIAGSAIYKAGKTCTGLTEKVAAYTKRISAIRTAAEAGRAS